jgi:hypothetical protein
MIEGITAVTGEIKEKAFFLPKQEKYIPPPTKIMINKKIGANRTSIRMGAILHKMKTLRSCPIRQDMLIKFKETDYT